MKIQLRYSETWTVYKDGLLSRWTKVKPNWYQGLNPQLSSFTGFSIMRSNQNCRKFWRKYHSKYIDFRVCPMSNLLIWGRWALSLTLYVMNQGGALNLFASHCKNCYVNHNFQTILFSFSSIYLFTLHFLMSKQKTYPTKTQIIGPQRFTKLSHFFTLDLKEYRNWKSLKKNYCWKH